MERRKGMPQAREGKDLHRLRTESEIEMENIGKDERRNCLFDVVKNIVHVIIG